MAQVTACKLNAGKSISQKAPTLFCDDGDEVAMDDKYRMALQKELDVQSEGKSSR